MSRTDKLVRLLDDAERVLLAVVSRLGPWLSPVAPAYSVYLAAVRVLEWPQWVAILMALAIEAAGVSSFHLTMRLWAWNQEKNKSDPSAPVWVGVLLIVVYLLVGIGVAVVIGLVPDLVPFTPAAFFVLAAVGYAVLAMMTDQARRERVVVSERERLRRERAERREERKREQAIAGVARVADFDAELAAIREMASGSTFGREQGEAWLDVGRTKFYKLMSYGERVGAVQRVSHGQYRCVNHTGKERDNDV